MRGKAGHTTGVDRSSPSDVARPGRPRHLQRGARPSSRGRREFSTRQMSTSMGGGLPMSRKEQGKGMSKGMSPELIEKMLDGHDTGMSRPIEAPSLRPVPAPTPGRRRSRSTAEKTGGPVAKRTKPGKGSGPAR